MSQALFQAIYGEMLDKVYMMAGLTNVDNDFLAQVAKYSGLVNVDKTANRMVTRRRVAELSGIDTANLGNSAHTHRERLGTNGPH